MTKSLYSEHKTGVTNLLSKEESQESLQLALNAWKTRSKLEPKIGKENTFLQIIKRLNV
jgi:hypothetical protein